LEINEKCNFKKGLMVPSFFVLKNGKERKERKGKGKK